MPAVSTVDAFQGAEKNIIIVSVCRSSSPSSFVSSPQRMNVALTRAKRHLVVVGDGSALQTNALWQVVPVQDSAGACR
jgi:superfamily I DNA and/or RNA helicase